MARGACLAAERAGRRVRRARGTGRRGPGAAARGPAGRRVLEPGRGDAPGPPSSSGLRHRLLRFLVRDLGACTTLALEASASAARAAGRPRTAREPAMPPPRSPGSA
ncbi:hypothetical protein LT493_17830 [Streptomyces tricolor]|nr:hypothetical protein [Streptomyces tricolor]